MDITRNEEATALLITQLLEGFGEDVSREGLRETPKRVARLYKDLLEGYSKDPASVIKTFPCNGYRGLVVVEDLSFYSLCEHHLIPFFGKVHIGYIPSDKILGLSKFARLIEIFSRRLQTQENLTYQIAEELNEQLQPKGLIVQIEAEHLCMSMRGAKKENAITKTFDTRGELRSNQVLLNEFFNAIGASNGHTHQTP